MKKKTKIILSSLALLSGTVILSSCTANFCTNLDKAHILYLYDIGSTVYTSDAQRKSADGETTLDNEIVKINGKETKVYSYQDASNSYGISKVNEAASKKGYQTPSILFWKAIDQIVLEETYNFYSDPENQVDFSFPSDLSTVEVTDLRADIDNYSYETLGLLDKFGYLKFAGDNEKGKTTLFINWDTYVDKIFASPSDYNLTVDDLPTTDYISTYKSTMKTYVASSRSCLAIKSGLYGAYGPNKLPIEVSVKKWTDWKGLLEFLFVWPLGALIDVITSGLLSAGVAGGWSQLIAILVVTFIVRSIMLLVTFKQTQSTSKMNALQPELAKIQAKYPNANTNKYEKARMAAEQQKLYKKNKINPLTSIIMMVVQLPVFICVYGAMQGSAWLSTGQFLGLRLSDSISSVLFNAAGWASGSAVTALILFIIMAGVQTVSMILPNILQKRRNKNLAKLGRNPTQTQQAKTMKIFTYVMLAMIIIMGFSLASAIVVYWIVGALFSIVQTLITHKLSMKNQK